MHTLNLIAMGIGYASLCFTLVVVIAMIVCWIAGVTQRPANIKKSASAKSDPWQFPAPVNSSFIRAANEYDRHRRNLTLVRGGRYPEC